MYKNQLQELAQRSCFNLPSYTCIREGPDHAPRFKAAVNFNGETFESPSYCSTLRQAEHSAAEVALDALACRGPSNSLAARILDETGVYKNLLQEVSQRVGASLPCYTTFRSGLGHLPVFTCTVELAGVIFTGEPAKNKKQAEKNAALAAWLSLKSLVQQSETPNEKAHRVLTSLLWDLANNQLVQQSETPNEKAHKDEQEHVTVARALHKYLINARLARLSFPIKFPHTLNTRPSSNQPSAATTSKILPLICPKTAHRSRPVMAANNLTFQKVVKTQPQIMPPNSVVGSLKLQPQKFPAAGAPPYIPVRHCSPHNRMAPPVTIRNSIPVFSAPPLPHSQQSLVLRPPALGMAPPVCIRQPIPAFAAPVMMDELNLVHPAIKVERLSKPMAARVEEALPISRAVVRVEEPPGRKLLPVSIPPNSEVPKVQVDLSSPKVFTVLEPHSEETKLQCKKSFGANEIEDLKDLKI